MEDLMKNLESIVQLLAVSHTECVKEWNMETVDRAFQWAQYCEHVHSRFHTNQTVRAALEKRLCETNEQLELTLAGYNNVTWSDLSQCRHRLLLGLLKNPATPHFLIRSLLHRVDGSHDGDSTVPEISGLIGYQSACKLFSELSLSHFGLGFSFTTQVHGLMLLQCLHTLQSHPGNDTYAKTQLDSVFAETAEMNSFSDLLAAALLSADSVTEDTTGLLLEWLQMHHDLLHSMCQSLPPDVCTKLSKQYPKFRLAYWNTLKKWASLLDFDVSNGLWVEQSDGAVSFQTLVDRVKSLWSSEAPLKEDTVRELTVLKQSDGDFEVQGLSVWTDLLLHLN